MNKTILFESEKVFNQKKYFMIQCKNK
jgi:hypothetical protein